MGRLTFSGLLNSCCELPVQVLAGFLAEPYSRVPLRHLQRRLISACFSWSARTQLPRLVSANCQDYRPAYRYRRDDSWSARRVRAGWRSRYVPLAGAGGPALATAGAVPGNFLTLDCRQVAPARRPLGLPAGGTLAAEAPRAGRGRAAAPVKSMPDAVSGTTSDARSGRPSRRGRR
jgi:hypothetical protein